MNKTLIVRSAIVAVEVHKRDRAKFYSVVEAQTNNIKRAFNSIFGKIYNEKHVVFCFVHCHRYTLEEFENKKSLVIIDDKVYCKPYIVINVSNGEYERKDFETPEELDKYVEDLTKGMDIITIEKS